MDKILDLLGENLLGLFLIIGALSFLVISNQAIHDGTNAMKQPTTVYVKAENQLEQHLWTGAQVQYLLWSIEDLDYSIAVGALDFANLKSVRKHVETIPSNAKFNMKKYLDSTGKIVRIEFTYA